MGHPTGFKDFERQDRTYTSVIERLKSHEEMMAVG